MAETAVQERQRTNLDQALINSRRGLISLLGSPEKADSFMVAVRSLGSKTPDLHTCSYDSLCYAINKIASQGLNPALPNEAWIIPRQGKAEPQYGYGGLRKMVLRSGEVIDCFARDVRANDAFQAPADIVSPPTHRIPDAFAPRGRVIGYYAVAQLKCGNWRFWPMSVAEVEKHRDQYAQRSKKTNEFGTSWSKGDVDREGLSSFDKMGLKTCLAMLCNPRDFSLEPDVWEAILTSEEPRKTAAEHQGYDRQGNRPKPAALTMGTGIPIEEVFGNTREMSDTLLYVTGQKTAQDAPGSAIAPQHESEDGRQKPKPSTGTQGPSDSLWREVAQAHLEELVHIYEARKTAEEQGRPSASTGELAGLLEDVRDALNDPQFPDGKGHALINAMLDWTNLGE